MQRTSTKVQSLAERVREGDTEYPSSKELMKDADRLLKKAVDSNTARHFKQGLEYCRAAYEDLDLAHEISTEPEVVYDKKNELALCQHRLQVNVYIDEERYQKALEEVAAAKELYEVLEENNKLKLNLKFWMSDMSRLEKVAKEKLGNPIEMPRPVFLQNMLDLALAEERYEDAAMLKRKMDALLAKIEIIDVRDGPIEISDIEVNY